MGAFAAMGAENVSSSGSGATLGLPGDPVQGCEAAS
jgi:hypothetical protein